MTSARVKAINISVAKGTEKTSISTGVIGPFGIEGDAHAGNWHRQISFLASENIDLQAEATGRFYAPGQFGENITCVGLDTASLRLFDRLHIGKEVVLEITQFGKKCHGAGCAIYQEVGQCIMPKEGFFARTVRGGHITTDDAITIDPQPLKLLVLTLSDRASSGEYTDRSGPALVETVSAFLSTTRMGVTIKTAILPDDRSLLSQRLEQAKSENFSVVFTTGGTGIGPRDITPEVVKPLLSKEIPGIMELIRVKYGQILPQAALSRSVAGVMGDSTLVYTLPGSVKAVKEYLTEILPTLQHSLFMLRGIDQH